MPNLSMLYSIDSIVGAALVCLYWVFLEKEVKGVRAAMVRMQSHLLHL